jgi:hypothetical protein
MRAHPARRSAVELPIVRPYPDIREMTKRHTSSRAACSQLDSGHCRPYRQRDLSHAANQITPEATRYGRRLATSTVTGKGNFAMTAASIATCAKTLLDRKDQGEIPSGVLGVDDVFNLSEVRAGFEAQGIRIAALS